MSGEPLPYDLDEELGPEFPRQFGNYLFLTRLARGGMGEVFLAKHGGIAGIEKYCVVKTLRPHYTDDREYKTRFIDEARVVVQLSHRNIAQVFDVGRVGEQYYLAMEFIQGLDLRSLQNTLISQGQNFSPGLGLHILCEVLEALDYAHRHEDPATGAPLFLVHRDVSPQNIMINLEGEVKLIDFGLAASELKLENTQPNVVMGKLAYMAPEHARGDPVNGQADLFSAAVMGYELVSGERFYAGMTQHEMWSISGRGGHRPPHYKDLPEALRAILDKGLAPDRADRFKSCAEFREAVEAYRFSNRLRERSSSLRELVGVVSPEAAAQNRQLLKSFANVSLEGDAIGEESESLALASESNVMLLTDLAPAMTPDGEAHEDTVVDMVPSNPHLVASPGGADLSQSGSSSRSASASVSIMPSVYDEASPKIVSRNAGSGTAAKVALLGALILIGVFLGFTLIPHEDKSVPQEKKTIRAESVATPTDAKGTLGVLVSNDQKVDKKDAHKEKEASLSTPPSHVLVAATPDKRTKKVQASSKNRVKKKTRRGRSNPNTARLNFIQANCAPQYSVIKGQRRKPERLQNGKMIEKTYAACVNQTKKKK